jgi:hypothetical protein
VNTTLLKAVAAVAMAAAAAQPTLAQDQPMTAAPVSIASCSIVPTYDSVLANESEDPVEPTGSAVWITFLNHSARTITEVTFNVEGVDGSARIADRGHFSSGVTIQHALGPLPDMRGDTTCGVYSVRYDNGTVWTRP